MQMMLQLPILFFSPSTSYSEKDSTMDTYRPFRLRTILVWLFILSFGVGFCVDQLGAKRPFSFAQTEHNILGGLRFVVNALVSWSPFFAALIGFAVLIAIAIAAVYSLLSYLDNKWLNWKESRGHDKEWDNIRAEWLIDMKLDHEDLFETKPIFMYHLTKNAAQEASS